MYGSMQVDPAACQLHPCLATRVNIQDGACIHCTFERCGHDDREQSIGHPRHYDGCELHDNVLIGMGIANGPAVVHITRSLPPVRWCWKNTVCEAGSIYAGVPAKKVKIFQEDKISGEINRIADNYVRYAGWFLNP